MSRQPRLLHLTTTPLSLDWLLAPQLTAFQQAGFDVLTASAPGPHVDALREKGIAHVVVPSLSRNMEPSRDVRAAKELGALFARVEPDIVHTHNPKPGVLGRVIARRGKVPIVVNTVHGLYAQPTDQLLRRTAVYGLERIAAACSDAELVQNPEDLATLRALGVPGDRLHLLGNGIDLDRFTAGRTSRSSADDLRRELRIDAGVPVIGMVGRLVWEKGYREFFEAIRGLRERAATRFEVVVVGPHATAKVGAVDQQAIDAMERLGVRFLGSRSDVANLLELFDVFALPSYREGFPRAAMEASARGVPVVATDIRGCRQVVVDGQTGLLVPPRDSTALREALATLLADAARRHDMGVAAARRAATEFDQARVIARTLAVYRMLLRRKGLPSAQATTSRYNDSIDLVAVDASKRVAERVAA